MEAEARTLAFCEVDQHLQPRKKVHLDERTHKMTCNSCWQRNHYREHPEVPRAWRKTWRGKHPDLQHCQSKEWRRTHPKTRNRVRQRNYALSQVGNFREGEPWLLIELALILSEYRLVDRDLHLLLGRSVQAIQLARWRWRKGLLVVHFLIAPCGI